MSVWTVLWVGWLLQFLVIEGLAIGLAKDKGATLSDHIWAFIGRGKALDRHVRFRRIIFLAFSAWLVVHLWTGYV